MKKLNIVAIMGVTLASSALYLWSHSIEDTSEGKQQASAPVVKQESSEGDVSSPKSEEPRQAIMPDNHEEVFEKYCFECHDSFSEDGGLNLEELSYQISKDIETAETWQKVLNALNSGEMPPEDEAQLPAEAKSSLLEDLSTEMVMARKILSDNGGKITLRRLNRREYVNTVEDLLGVRPISTGLPDDRSSSGFDTAGASLFFSSDQLENYLGVARKTLKLALSDTEQKPSKVVRIEGETEGNGKWGNVLRGLKESEARVIAAKANPDKPRSDYGFLDDHQLKKEEKAIEKYLPQLELYFERPETKTGATFIMTVKRSYTRIRLPDLGEDDGGTYTVRVRGAAYKEAQERLQYLELVSIDDENSEHLGWRKLVGTLDAPEEVEFTFEHPMGEKRRYHIHQRTHQDRADKNLWLRDREANGIGTPPGAWVDWAEIEGPHPVESSASAAKEILFEKPADWDELQYIREVFRRFAFRAFRGIEPSSEFLDRLVEQYEARLSIGESELEALIRPLSIILSSPSFLYMVESSGDEETPLLTARELAVRLSYFLWSTMPDEELMSLAQNGSLSDPEVLKAQTQRLLEDPRSEGFIDGFVDQWFEMERLETFQFNGLLFPKFDNATRESARKEVFETVKNLLEEGLPLDSLLKADYVIVNDILASYYGLEGVVGPEFRKVALPEDSIRGGLLGSAAVLAMGSDGLRSSPVERGVWVLRHLLNKPPPPAPPNVPQLGRLAGQLLSARELQKAHQEEPQCAQCHKKIDPIGYGLENFDAVGEWRDVEIVSGGKAKKRKKKTEKEFDIEPHGKLPGGKEFSNFFELRDAVAEERDGFASGLVEALISYGLGRPYGFTDYDLAAEIQAEAKESNYQLATFVHALVQSPQFQNK